MAVPLRDRPSIAPPADAVVSIVEEHIFSLELSGFMTAALGRQTVVRTRDLLRGRRVRVGVADTIHATGTEMAIQAPVREFVALTREHGVGEVFCAAISPAMRLFGSAIALAVGVRIHFFPTVEAAWAAARIAVRRG
jgi:hypothetical protein